MKGEMEVVKGRIEEAAGTLIGNDKLRSRGQVDQAVGHARQAATKGVRHAEESARKIMDKARDVAQGVVNKARGKGEQR